MQKINDFACTNPLASVHPIEKALLSLSLLLVTNVTNDLFVALLTFLVMSAAIMFKANISAFNYGKLLILPGFFLMSSIMVIVITVAPLKHPSLDVIWAVSVGSWQLSISEHNIEKAIYLLANVLASISCLYFLILTTPLHQIIWLLQKVKAPALFIELTGLTYRFIFVLLDTMQEIYLAQSSRLGYNTIKVSFISIAQLITGVLIKSIQVAKELQVALNSRGGSDALYDVDLQLKLNHSRCMWMSAGVLALALFSFVT